MADNQGQSKTMHLADKHLELPPLTQEELSLLDTWLRPLKPGLSLFHVHGFLCATLTTPVEIPPSDYFPAMLVSDLPDIVPEADMQLYLDMVMQLKLELSESLSHDDVVQPLLDFRPMPPLNANRLFQDQRAHLKEWCQGYLSAVTLRRKYWQPLQDFQNLELVLQVIANETQAAKIIGINHKNLSQGQIQTLIDQMINSLPVLLSIVYDQACEIDETKPNHKHKETDINILFSQEKAKRQAPCPCGSTKPFVECCALSRETRH